MKQGDGRDGGGKLTADVSREENYAEKEEITGPLKAPFTQQ